jgi:hypothetical protein
VTEKLLAPAYGEDMSQDPHAIYDFLAPVVASLMGTRAIPLTPTSAAFSGSVSAASLTTSGGISAVSGTFTGNVTIAGTLGVTLATTLSSTLGVTGLATLTGGYSSRAASTQQGNLTVQNSVPTVALLVDVTAGGQFVRIGSSGVPLLLGDIQNNKVLVGQGTDPSVASERLVVLGGPIVPGYDNDQSLVFKRPAGGTFSLGTSAGSPPLLALKDNAGTQIAAFLPSGGGQGLIVGTSTSFTASENFKVEGGSRLQGAVLVTTGGLTVTAGGLTVTAGGVSIVAGGLGVTGAALFNDGMTIAGGSPPLTITGSGNRIAFSGSSQTVSSVTGGAATALPAQPVAYLKVEIGGNNYAIPYYNQ